MNELEMQQFEPLMIPVNETAIALDDQMLLMDSLECPLRTIDEQWLKQRFPMRLPLSCLLVVEQGALKLNVNCREYVASDNTCVFICKGAIVGSMAVVGDARVILLSFSQMDVPAVKTGCALLPLCDEHMTMLKQAYQMLRSILKDDAFALNRAAVADSCLNFIGSLVAQVVQKHMPDAKPSRRDEIVTRFTQCVHENYREHRDVGFYAERLGLSLKYMSRVVLEQTGRHPASWIKDYVILDAKSMLRSGKYTVQQVADELHFPNQSFFGKYFKEAVGVSPKKWK